MDGRVIAGKVCIKPIETPSQTKGGIYIPRNAKQQELKAEVISVGKSTSEEEIEVKPGDIILTNINFGTKFEYDGVQYRLINHKEILFIF
jgi:chaperonin GroES